MYKTVFILGAGASADAGIPVMADFLDKARDLYSENLLSSEEKLAFQRVFSAIHQLKGISFYSNLDLNNIETVFSAFDMGKLLGRLGNLTKDEIEDVNRSVHMLIGSTIDFNTSLKHRGEGNYSLKGPYQAFAQFLKSVFFKDNRISASIITFNYDIALEYALHRENILPNYHLGDTTEVGDITLLKLHGSVNWGLSNNQIVMQLRIRDYINKYGIAGDAGRFWLFMARQFYIKNEKRMDNVSGPVLIPPTWSKGEHYDKINKVWKKAAETLSDAEAIYVIGYSLPETDMFFRFLFALATHSESSIRRFWIFDPSESIKNRFLNLLGPGLREEPRFHFEKCKFGAAIRYLKENP